MGVEALRTGAAGNRGRGAASPEFDVLIPLPFLLGAAIDLDGRCSLSVILTSVITQRSPGLTAAPKSATCWATRCLEGMTVPFLILRPLSPCGNITRANTRSDLQAADDQDARLVGHLLGRLGGSGGLGGLGGQSGKADRHRPPSAASAATRTANGDGGSSSTPSGANYKPNCGGGGTVACGIGGIAFDEFASQGKTRTDRRAAARGRARQSAAPTERPVLPAGWPPNRRCLR